MPGVQVCEAHRPESIPRAMRRMCHAEGCEKRASCNFEGELHEWGCCLRSGPFSRSQERGPACGRRLGAELQLFVSTESLANLSVLVILLGVAAAGR